MKIKFSYWEEVYQFIDSMEQNLRKNRSYVAYCDASGKKINKEITKTRTLLQLTFSEIENIPFEKLVIKDFSAKGSKNFIRYIKNEKELLLWITYYAYTYNRPYFLKFIDFLKSDIPYTGHIYKYNKMLKILNNMDINYHPAYLHNFYLLINSNEMLRFFRAEKLENLNEYNL